MPGYLQRFLLKALALVLLFTLCRLLFLVWNNDHFPIVYFTDFLAGIWFDLVTVAIAFLPLIALELFPNKWRGSRPFQLVLVVAFQLIAFLTILINLIDVEYFRHSASRSNASLIKMLGFGQDFQQQLPSVFTDYWPLLIALIAFMVLSFWLYQRINRIPDDSRSQPWWKQVLIFPVIAFIFVLIGRGGFGLKPIAPPKAAAFTIDQNMQLVLNSAFTVIKSWGNEELKEKDYFEPEALKKIYDPIRQYQEPPILEQPNIVILLLESFSVEYIGSINDDSTTYTPFLDSLIGTSFVFNNCYANGKKSMDAMPSVISSIPKLMEVEYLASNYATNQIESLPKLLKKKGYESAFFHGATNGSMNFDVFADVSGFDHYFGRTEYDNDDDFDGTWGIFDEPFYEWSADQMNTFQKPFFSTIFSISSHPPYTIPSAYKNRFNTGPTEMHDAVQYADYALSRFFERVKQYDWYDHTLFVLVADHTPASGTPVYFKDMGNMHIPLAFFHPKNEFFNGTSEKIVSQIDIMPTIMHLTGYDAPFFAFGQSVFDEAPGFSASYIGDKFLYFGTVNEEHYLLIFQEEKCLGIYELTDLLQSKNLKDETSIRLELEKQLKALIQTYNHTLITNEMRVDS